MNEPKGGADGTVDLRFFGHSDDCAEFEASDGRSDEHYVGADGRGVYRIASGLFVVLRYEKNSCWSAGVYQQDAETPVPSWPVVVRQSRVTPYSVEVVVTAPAGVEVVFVEGA